MQRRNTVLLAISVFLVTVFTAVTIAADNNVGTWKMDTAKSKFSPGPAPKSQTLKIATLGADGVKFVADGMDADGKVTHWELTRSTTASSCRSRVIRTRTCSRTSGSTRRRSKRRRNAPGKVTGTTMIVVSADGKTRTLTQTGTNAKGETINNVIVYGKQ
jgi:hypothetical protein